VLAVDDLGNLTTYGEDVAFNARKAMQLAPNLCCGCADEHIDYALTRPFAADTRIDGDRSELVALLRSLIAAGLARSAPVHILLAGSADTGLLATAAHAAFGVSGEVGQSVHFTVLDLCPTPLALCAEFARRHGLTLATHDVDLTAEGTHFAADIVVVHSLFRHLPLVTRSAVLARLGAWLKPGGRLVFSSSLFSPSEKDAYVRSSAMQERLRRAIEQGQFDAGEPIEAFLARRRRRAAAAGSIDEFGSVAEAEALFREAGLRVVSIQEVVRIARVDDIIWPPKRRVLAALGVTR
jgi:SAM-dependent methyltransferase